MKKIGIVGGTAWPSTVEYYSELCRRSEERHRARKLQGAPATAEMCIESLDLRKAVAYLGRDGDEASWSRFDEYHRAALRRLEASGAEFALIASNTPHHRFAAIVRGIAIPVISIIEVVARECARIGAGQVLVLGTALTMRSATFRHGFAEHGIDAAGPQDEAVRVATIELIAELQLGRIAGAAQRISRIARSSFNRQCAARPVVCLACTELPLAFPELKSLAAFDFDGASYVNTSAVHVDAAFEFASRETPPQAD